MEIKKNLRLIFRLLGLIGLMMIFYTTGVPLEIIVILAILYLTLIFYRDKIKSKIDRLLHAHIPGFENQHKFVKTAVIFIFFILVYVILKQILFFGLSLFGIDMQKIILNSLGVNV